MKRFLSSFALVAFLASFSFGQAEKVQAMFVYNFTKYIEWPTSAKSGNFVIAVVGNSPIYEELIKVAESKTVGNQAIVIKKINGPAEVEDQHIIYISQNKASSFGHILEKVGSKPILVITETAGSLEKGASINFVVIDNKQRFEMKKENITSRGMKISSELDKFAILK